MVGLALLSGCAENAGSECVAGEANVDSLGKVLFGSAELMRAGQPGRVTVRWREGSCRTAPTVRATWTDPEGHKTSLSPVALEAPFEGVLEASFELTPQVAGQHLLEAVLEPGSVQATVEVIVAADHTDAPVFEEAISPSMVDEEFDRRWVARTTTGLLIVGGRLSRAGQQVTPPSGWPSDPNVVVAVGTTVWTLESKTVARWRDDEAQLVLDGVADVPTSCTPHFASADDFFCSAAGARIELHWNGSAISAVEVATAGSGQLAFDVAGRRVLWGEVEDVALGRNVLCDVEPQEQVRTCHATVNLHGLSPAGPLVRDWSNNALGVAGREGHAWWYRTGGLTPSVTSVRGLVDDEAVELEPNFVNVDLPRSHRSLLMTATAAGLQFQQYELGPPLTVGQPPHRILAVLHDWVVVARMGVTGRVFFIARR